MDAGFLPLHHLAMIWETAGYDPVVLSEPLMTTTEINLIKARPGGTATVLSTRRLEKLRANEPARIRQHGSGFYD